MDKRLSRLINLNAKLDDLVQFDHSVLDDAGIVASGAGLGIGGYKALQAVRKKQFGNAGVLVGGPAAGVSTAKPFGAAAKEVAADVYHGAPGAVRTGLQNVGKKALSGWDSILQSMKLARVRA